MILELLNGTPQSHRCVEPQRNERSRELGSWKPPTVACLIRLEWLRAAQKPRDV